MNPTDVDSVTARYLIRDAEHAEQWAKELHRSRRHHLASAARLDAQSAEAEARAARCRAEAAGEPVPAHPLRFGAVARLARHLYLTAVGNDPHEVRHWDSGAAGDSVYRKYEQQAEAAIAAYEGRES